MRACPIGKRNPPPHCQGSSPRSFLLLESCHCSYSSSTMDVARTKLKVAPGSIVIPSYPRCEVGIARVATSLCPCTCAPNRLIRQFISLCGSSTSLTFVSCEAHNSPILCFISTMLTTHLEEPLHPCVFRTTSPAVAHVIALFSLPVSHCTPRVCLSYRPARRQCQQIAGANPCLSLPVPLHSCVDSPWRV